MRKRLAAYLVFLSVVANIFLGMQIYNRDVTLNRTTWGYAVNALWKHINWASLDITVRSDGRVMGPNLEGVQQALEDLDALQYLPFYQQRAGFEDINTLRQFLRYADRAYTLALKEQGDAGKVSPESTARLQKIHEGLELVLRSGNPRTNELVAARSPWNHGAWRTMWREIADSLRQQDFVPLPE